MKTLIERLPILHIHRCKYVTKKQNSFVLLIFPWCINMSVICLADRTAVIADVIKKLINTFQAHSRIHQRYGVRLHLLHIHP